MTQGLLPFQYQIDEMHKGTAMAGLPLFMDLANICGLTKAIERNLSLKEQGWTDTQILLSLIMLNLSGGDCVDDIERLEADPGMRTLLLRMETHGMKRKRRRDYERRFRKSKARAFPSPSAIRRYLENFHNESEEVKRIEGKAFIPAANKHLQSLLNTNDVLIHYLQKENPSEVATLDQDATLSETTKRDAFYSYKKFKAYQPFNTYWHEQGLVLHSEFRDGNVNAGFEQLRCFKEALTKLPGTVKKVYLRSDSAGYQEELLTYCAEGKNERFGVIEFAIASRVTADFKAAVAELKASDWKPIYTALPNGEQIESGQEYSEVCYVPSWVAKSKKGPEYRYIAIREVFKEQLSLDGVDPVEQTLPFQTMKLGNKKYKLFGMVTNRDIDGAQLITWHRERCGDSEKIHSIQKNDFCGGQFPSNKFGTNAAWWQIMVMTLNLVTLMKKLVLPELLKKKRMKGLRFHIINIAGHVVTHARGVILKLSGDSEITRNLLLIRHRLGLLAMPAPKSASG